jgi:hypothetical protein
MANSQSSEKRWKYVSIGLMAILALGFSFPQAFAHVTSDMKHGIEHVIALLTDIQTKVTGIKTVVDTNLDTKVSSRATPLQVTTGVARSDLSELDELQCTSSSDFIAHVSLITRGNGGALIISPSSAFFDIKETGYLEFGSSANQPLGFRAVATLPDLVSAHITIETAQGATVLCENS